MNTPSQEDICKTLALVCKVLATHLQMTQQLGSMVLPLDTKLSEADKADAAAALNGLQALVQPLQTCALNMEKFRGN